MLNEILLDKYRIEEELKPFPVALVYRGVNVDAQQAVTVTVFDGEIVPSQDFLVSFQGVVEKLRKLDSPSIVSVLDYGEIQNQAVVVQEFIKGQALSEMLIEKAGLPVSLVLDIAQLIGGYLDELHQVGIVHGSLDPQYIIMATDGNIKVLNAGLAQSSGIPNLIAANKVDANSFHAPEVRLGEDMTPRSDFYALGAILFEALSGEPLGGVQK